MASNSNDHGCLRLVLGAPLSQGADPRDRRPLRTNWNLRCRLRFDGGRIRVSGSSPVSRTGGWRHGARICARSQWQTHCDRNRLLTARARNGDPLPSTPDHAHQFGRRVSLFSAPGGSLHLTRRNEWRCGNRRSSERLAERDEEDRSGSHLHESL